MGTLSVAFLFDCFSTVPRLYMVGSGAPLGVVVSSLGKQTVCTPRIVNGGKLGGPSPQAVDCREIAQCGASEGRRVSPAGYGPRLSYLFPCFNMFRLSQMFGASSFVLLTPLKSFLRPFTPSGGKLSHFRPRTS